MHHLNPLFAVIVFLIAYATAYIVNLKYKLHSVNNRYETIDGLRGFLALSVFIHHACIWRDFSMNNVWRAPESNLYNHFGQTSVAFFFMITSFLFVTKLLNSGEKEFSWKQFFTSRIFRLVPMYYVSVVLVIVGVMILTDWQLHTSIFDFVKSIGKWLTFTIFKSQINNSDLTFIIGAGVVWSLPYEWLFYFSLPLIGVFLLKKKPHFIVILISLAFVIVFPFIHETKMAHIYSFLGGAIAPFLLKYTQLKDKIKELHGSIAIVICLLLIGLFKTADLIICKLLIAIVFTLIAMGNTFFGILKNSTVKFLGEICYSTYLLHGIILFGVLYFGFGVTYVKQLKDYEYCLLVFGITPIVVWASYLGFRYVEKPFMEISRRKTSR